MLELRTTRGELAAALTRTRPAIDRAHAVAIFRAVKLETTDHYWTATASDMELTVSVTSQNAAAHLPGTVLVDHKQLSAAAKGGKKTDQITLTELADSVVRVEVGNATYNLEALELTDYSKLPTVDGDPQQIYSDILANLIPRVLTAAGKDQSRPVLCSVLLELEKGTLRMVATDSYRLVIAESDETVDGELELLIPWRALKTIQGAMKATKATRTTVQSSSTHAAFTVGGVTITVRLIDGQFPKYEQLMPESKDYTSHFVGDAQKLAETIRAVGGGVKKQTATRLELTPTGSTATFVAAGDVLEAKAPLELTYFGTEPMTIGVNADFLADALESIGDNNGAEARVELINPLRPFVVSGPYQHRALVMPIRLSS